jgi:hypothetical protein
MRNLFLNVSIFAISVIELGIFGKLNEVLLGLSILSLCISLLQSFVPFWLKTLQSDSIVYLSLDSILFGTLLTWLLVASLQRGVIGQAWVESISIISIINGTFAFLLFFAGLFGGIPFCFSTIAGEKYSKHLSPASTSLLSPTRSLIAGECKTRFYLNANTIQIKIIQILNIKE